jgi:LmbE family N-acetylglucosaminyl deacetylase
MCPELACQTMLAMDLAARIDPVRDGSPLTLLGVWAHPDDEAYLSAGLMARVAETGGAVVCLHATDGEQGTDDPAAWPPERLAPVRRAELRASLAALGVTDLRRMALPDGGLDAADQDAGVAVVTTVMRAVKPDVVVTFGPDGMTGHGDHRTVSWWATEAWRRTDGRAELLYATTTDAFVDRNLDLYQQHDLVFTPDLPLRTPPEQVALDVALSERELDRKLVALHAHASQTRPLVELLGPDRYRRWVDHEWFRHPTAAEVDAVVPGAA